MDKAISRDRIRRRQRRSVAYVLGGIALVFGSIWIFREWAAASVQRNELMVGEVNAGEMYNTVSATGTVEPSSEIVLVSPLSAKIRQIVVENGRHVTAGEAILLLDTEYAQLEYARLQDELKWKENNVVRLQLELEKNIRDIELDDQVKDLQVKNYEALVSDAQRLQAIGGVTQEEVDQARQNLAIAILEKKKLENELQYRKASIASSVLNEKLQSSIQQQRLNELAKKLSSATISAEAEGVITWLDNRIGSQVQEGDPLVRLANVSTYSIMAQASDMHADKIHAGQRVEVEINKAVEVGTIEQILPAVENNTIQFKIKLQNAGSEKWRAKMKVPVQIVTDVPKQSIFIPNGPAILAGKSQYVFVLQENRAVRRKVTLGYRTSNKVEVMSGLEVGERVILSDMKRFEGRKELKVR